MAPYAARASTMGVRSLHATLLHKLQHLIEHFLVPEHLLGQHRFVLERLHIRGVLSDALHHLRHVAAWGRWCTLGARRRHPTHAAMRRGVRWRTSPLRPTTLCTSPLHATPLHATHLL